MRYAIITVLSACAVVYLTLLLLGTLAMAKLFIEVLVR